MTNHKNIPALRFKEFVGEWEVKKLNDVSERIKRKNTIDNQNVLTISAQYGLISQLDFFNKSVAAKNLTGYYLLRKGEFAYNKSYSRGYPMGAFKMLKLYDKGVISTLYICFKISDGVSGFFEHLFESGILNREIHKIAQEGARNHGLLNISIIDFFQIKITIPTKPEQQKIANFLTAIDKKIEHLRAKHRLLEAYKKGMMQQIFKQEIRFKDDDGEAFGDWEVKRLGEIAIRKTKKNTTDEIDFVLTNSATQGIVSQMAYFDKSIANKNNLTGYYIVDINDFVYNPRISTSAPVGPIKRNHLQKGVMSPLYSVFRFKKGNLSFFEFFFETTYWHRYMKGIANYGVRFDRMNITNADFLKMPIPFPCLKEQQKIANFLSSIDEKIGQVREQVQAMEGFKKGLLQRMFV